MELLTGLKHQLRLHAAHDLQGTPLLDTTQRIYKLIITPQAPILGDALYTPKSLPPVHPSLDLPPGRVFLHSATIGLEVSLICVRRFIFCDLTLIRLFLALHHTRS